MNLANLCPVPPAWAPYFVDFKTPHNALRMGRGDVGKCQRPDPRRPTTGLVTMRVRSTRAKCRHPSSEPREPIISDDGSTRCSSNHMGPK
jgi:hypothetical protein